MYFGSCNDALRLPGKPLGVAGRQDDRGPVEGRSYEWLAFAAVLNASDLAECDFGVRESEIHGHTFFHPSSRFERSYFNATSVDLSFESQV